MGAFFEAIFYSFLVVIEIIAIPAICVLTLWLVCFAIKKLRKKKK